MTKPAGLVLGWMPYSRRSRTIADRLGFDAELIARSGFRRPWTAAFVYPWLAIKTILVLIRRRPEALIVVAPPFVAPLVAVPVARILGARVAVDIHTGALIDRRWSWSIPVLVWTLRLSVVSIVTLESLGHRLRRRSLNVLVLPDPLPSVPAPSEDRAEGVKDAEVVAICGWGRDEPIDVLVQAARGQKWQLAITGDAPKSLKLPRNARLTGFLPDAQYDQLLANAACIVVLTTRDETLLSGAWEALAHRRPLVLSATRALRETFGTRVNYVEPTPESIRAGIATTVADFEEAGEAVASLAEDFERQSKVALETLRSALLTSD